MNFKEFITGYKGKDLPSELKFFNWGAFLLTFIWGYRFKAWITLLAIPLIWFQLPFGLNWWLLAGLQIYSGVQGNMWAYQVEWWKKPRDFRLTQTKWAFAGFAIHTIIPISILLLVAQFISKSPDNPIDFINNAQCSVSYKNIKQGLPKTSITNTSTPNEIAVRFSENFKNTHVDYDTVIYTVNGSGQKTDAYSLTFEKRGNSEDICNLDKQNCVIISKYIVPTDIMPLNECVFYFNNKKEIKPDAKTQKAIDKGLNIFKYL